MLRILPTRHGTTLGAIQVGSFLTIGCEESHTEEEVT
jgi:hypothetical protein